MTTRVGDRRRGLAGLLAAAALVLGCARAAERDVVADAGQPDLLVLVIDCLRFDHLGVNGHERPTTPNLDGLVSTGINFTRAYAQSRWTRPSVPSILTGLYPTEHGLMRLEEGEQATVTVALSPEVETLAERLQANGYATALFARQAQLASKFGLSQGFDVYETELAGAESIHRSFLEWTQTRDRQPFFAYLQYLEVHGPYCPPETTRGRFDPGTSDRDFCGSWGPLLRGVNGKKIELSREDVETARALYDEELLALDAQLGLFFDRLKQAGLWENALIVVTSDHGEEFYERGKLGHRARLHEELIRVPLIIKAPEAWEVVPGTRVEALVELRDLAPTLMEAAGGEVGDDEHSLLPWLMGRADRVREREFIVAETTEWLAVRAETLKLLARRDGSEEELYDLSNDPGETVSLAAERREDLERLHGLLREWRRGLRPVKPTQEELTEDTVEKLRALGYLD